MDLTKNQKNLVWMLYSTGGMWSVKRLAYELDWTVTQVRSSLYRLERRGIVRKLKRGGIWWSLTHKAYLAYKAKYIDAN